MKPIFSCYYSLHVLQKATINNVHAQPSYKYTWIYMYTVQTVANQGCNKG